MPSRPLIGCTTYRKTAQEPAINLYGLMPSYTQAIVAAGGLPILIPLGLTDQELGLIFERLDGVLLPGGGDIAPQTYGGQSHPAVADIDEDRDRVEFELARLAHAEKKPLLAICRGHQVFNVALGGSLWEDVHSQMPNAMVHDHDHLLRTNRPHEVHVDPNSRLAACLGTIVSPVNSLHHQGIRQLAPELVATSTAPDGLIESIEAPDHPFAIGVQWHPENLIQLDNNMLSLFQGFVAAARGA